MIENILSLVLAIFVLMVFMTVRNIWVYTKRIDLNRKCSKMAHNKIKLGVEFSIEEHLEQNYDVYWSYFRMFFSFWIWDIEKMREYEQK